MCSEYGKFSCAVGEPCRCFLFTSTGAENLAGSKGGSLTATCTKNGLTYFLQDSFKAILGSSVNVLVPTKYLIQYDAEKQNTRHQDISIDNIKTHVEYMGSKSDGPNGGRGVSIFTGSHGIRHATYCHATY